MMRRSVFQSQQAKHSRRKEDPTNALHHGSLLCSQTTSLSPAVHFQLLAPATHRFQAELAHSAVNLGHFETLSQKERDPLGLLLGRGLARAHAVSQDAPTVHKNLCQKGYVWVTMVIERALFLLLAAVWVIKTHFFASRCSLGHFSAFSRLGVLLWPGFFDKMPQL